MNPNYFYYRLLPILLISAIMAGCGVSVQVNDSTSKVHSDSSSAELIEEPPVKPIENPAINEMQQSLLKLINDARAEGRFCGSTYFPPVQAVTWNSSLEASAKLTVEQMAAENYFEHINPRTQQRGVDRIQSMGYPLGRWGENLAAGFPTGEQAMHGFKGLLKSKSHCEIIMRPYWQEVGWYRRATPEHSEYSYLGTQHFGQTG